MASLRPESLTPTTTSPTTAHPITKHPCQNTPHPLVCVCAQVHARNKKLDPEVDLREVAMRTPGFVGADLSNLLNEAAILAGRRGLKVRPGAGHTPTSVSLCLPMCGGGGGMGGRGRGRVHLPSPHHAAKSPHRTAPPHSSVPARCWLWAAMAPA